jgi:hypothetical protein
VSIDDILVEMIVLLTQIGILVILSIIGMKNNGSGGYQPKGYVTTMIDGKPRNIDINKLKIIPPKGGIAAVYPRKRNNVKEDLKK